MHDIWQDLANAIIIQAAKDYRRALHTLKKYPSHGKAQRVKTEVEQFFRSDWYADLSRIDGEVLLRRLNAEV